MRERERVPNEQQPATNAPAIAVPPKRPAWRTRLRRVALWSAVAIVAPIVLGFLYGCVNAWRSQVNARAKLAVRVTYAGQTGAEWLYGPYAGATDELTGHDTAIWLEPHALAQDGELRIFYQALAQLEDRQLESGLGFNPKGLARAVVTLGASGGSSLHDQACDALEDGFEPTWIEAVLPRPARRVINKIDNTLCGIGLARQRSPEQVVALYATYGYLGTGAYGVDSFARIYWRFDGVGDHRLDIGHQLVLAALFNKPWSGDAARWPAIEQRAQHGLELLIEAGILEPAQRAGIRKQIRRAKPRTKAELERAGLRRRLPRAPASLDYPIYRAAREAANELGSGWRTEVARLDLTVDLTRQKRALAASKPALTRGLVEQQARVTLAIVNHRGEYVVLHTGAPDFDESDRIRARRSPGSVTKLLVAAALARAYGSANTASSSSPIPAVQEALRRSSSQFFALANGLSLDAAYVGALIECYGDAHHGARENLIEDAAKGSLEASPEQLLPMLQDAHHGAALAMPDPHVVRSFTLRDGRELSRPRSASWHRRACAALIHNDGATYSWFEIPMRGTMIGASRRVDAGKTGSVGDAAEGDSSFAGVNYWTLAIGGRARAGDAYETGIVVLGADAFYDQGGDDMAIVGLEQASRSAVPLLSNMMR
jgi:hypothetical protein